MSLYLSIRPRARRPPPQNKGRGGSVRPCSDLYLGRALSHLVAQYKKIYTIERYQRNSKKTDNLRWSGTDVRIVFTERYPEHVLPNQVVDLEREKVKISQPDRHKNKVLYEIQNDGAYAQGNFVKDMERVKSYKTEGAPQFGSKSRRGEKHIHQISSQKILKRHICIMTNPATYYYFDKALENEDCFSDEETVNAGEVGRVQRFTLQVRASSSMEVDEKISECKKNLETELGVSSTFIP